MRFVENLLSMVISTALLFSGLVHAAQPYYFVHTVASYRLVSPQIAGLLGLWLPYLQLVLAVCIGLGIAERAALGMAALMFAAYSAAQLSVLARSMEIDCGCFGFVSMEISPASAAIPITLCACSLALFFKRKDEVGCLAATSPSLGARPQDAGQ